MLLLVGASDAKIPVSLEHLSDTVKRTDGEREDGESSDIMQNNESHTLKVCLIMPSFSVSFSNVFFQDTVNEDVLSQTLGRLDFGMRPGLDSSFSGSLDTLLSSHPSHEQNLASTPNRVEFSAKGGELQPWSFWPTFTPIEYGKSSNCSLSDLMKGSMPYEPLFDLALPKVASLFLERKTTEAIRRAEEESEHREELEGEDLSATSPLEVLDRVIQQGHDTHEKMLKRYASVPLTNDFLKCFRGNVTEECPFAFLQNSVLSNPISRPTLWR